MELENAAEFFRMAVFYKAECVTRCAAAVLGTRDCV